MRRTRTERRPLLVVLVDKPEGPTSHDVVRQARRALGTQRVGHTGTLDPLASGLLILCVGRATRLVKYFHLLPKAYDAELCLGVETASHDRSGAVVGRDDGWRRLSVSDLRAALSRHTGPLRQRPPAFSALRVGGRRAHELARQGEPPLLAERAVEVHWLELLDWAPPVARIRTTVSTGTYVRALARDVGRDLGCGAHLQALRRTAIGPYRVEHAVPLEELVPARSLPPAACVDERALLPWLPVRELSEQEASTVAKGGRVALDELVPGEWTGDLPGSRDADLPVRLCRAGELLAIAEPDGRFLRPRTVLA